jgi:hypothetical protein
LIFKTFSSPSSTKTDKTSLNNQKTTCPPEDKSSTITEDAESKDCISFEDYSPSTSQSHSTDGKKDDAKTKKPSKKTSRDLSICKIIMEELEVFIVFHELLL